MIKLKIPVKEVLKFREKIYINLGSHWTLKSCLWGRPEKSLGTPDLDLTFAGKKFRKIVRIVIIVIPHCCFY